MLTDNLNIHTGRNSVISNTIHNSYLFTLSENDIQDEKYSYSFYNQKAQKKEIIDSIINLAIEQYKELNEENKDKTNFQLVFSKIFNNSAHRYF